MQVSCISYYSSNYYDCLLAIFENKDCIQILRDAMYLHKTAPYKKKQLILPIFFSRISDVMDAESVSGDSEIIITA